MTLVPEMPLTPEPESVGPSPPTRRLLRTTLSLGRTRIGLVLAGSMIAVVLFGPYFAPHGPSDFAGAPNSSSPGLFGTDHLGQDVWSRFLYGGRTILAISAAATVIGLGLGLIVGLVAAYSRNWLDDLLMRGMDVLLAFPQIMLALVALVTLGPKTWLIILTVGLTTMPRVARVMRGAAQPIVERDFVAAADALGVPRWRILFGRGTAERAVAADGRDQPATDLRDRPGRHARLPRLHAQPGRRRLGADDLREPDRADRSAVGRAAAGHRDRAAHARHRPDRRRRRPRGGRHRPRAGANERAPGTGRRGRGPAHRPARDRHRHRRRHLASRSPRARCWAWSASRARARPPPAWRCSATPAAASRSPAARCRSATPTCWSSTPPPAAGCGEASSPTSRRIPPPR